MARILDRIICWELWCLMEAHPSGGGSHGSRQIRDQASQGRTILGFDHRAGHFRPLRIITSALEPIILSIVRCFCVVQKQKGVAGAVIEALSYTLHSLMRTHRILMRTSMLTVFCRVIRSTTQSTMLTKLLGGSILLTPI